MLFEHKNFLILSTRKNVSIVYKNRFEIGKEWIFQEQNVVQSP
ncbi:hypothetical protein LEP1GSC016_3177 [Leptospira borgpetersenii serovar Hardjo-bovis str. Sponselee]|uniref:Uncharacterized protein n=2 Tax=Leptospira borgpetersenii TaxID=174 RepID=M6C5J2_LEPBO|nr:hypothetical protein LEP1GSC016_3177 [Leptospira borgpetersenii serovar Hardjo-bovis str. Sponselee]EMO60681.1 hypothetical protein LEP1GSC133_1933 [Leptospira borgpetersenii serovar Pomona str. 200901868]